MTRQSTVCVNSKVSFCAQMPVAGSGRFLAIFEVLWEVKIGKIEKKAEGKTQKNCTSFFCISFFSKSGQKRTFAMATVQKTAKFKWHFPQIFPCPSFSRSPYQGPSVFEVLSEKPAAMLLPQSDIESAASHVPAVDVSLSRPVVTFSTST